MGWDALSGITLTREQKEQRRLQAARDLGAGMSRAGVARKYGVAYTSAWRWARTLQAEGMEGLRRRVARGSDSRLDEARKERLVAILEAGPRHYGWATDLWTARRIREVIRREFGVRYHLNHVPKLLHRLGFRPRRPKRRAVERDEARKEEWLGTTWVRLKKN